MDLGKELEQHIMVWALIIDIHGIKPEMANYIERWSVMVKNVDTT